MDRLLRPRVWRNPAATKALASKPIIRLTPISCVIWGSPCRSHSRFSTSCAGSGGSSTAPPPTLPRTRRSPHSSRRAPSSCSRNTALIRPRSSRAPTRSSPDVASPHPLWSRSRPLLRPPRPMALPHAAVGASVAVDVDVATAIMEGHLPPRLPGLPAPAPGANSWTGLVQAWPVPWRAPGSGVLGPRPDTPPQQAMYAAPSAPTATAATGLRRVTGPCRTTMCLPPPRTRLRSRST